jgi:hypothetical protein
MALCFFGVRAEQSDGAWGPIRPRFNTLRVLLLPRLSQQIAPILAAEPAMDPDLREIVVGAFGICRDHVDTGGLIAGTINSLLCATNSD